jgi:signal transduction histidine kinase
VLFTVRDEGSGIPDEQREHLFERYWRGRQPGEGVGLGLSIVKALVDGHRGRVWVESPPDGGTTFHVRLPRTAHAPRERT